MEHAPAAPPAVPLQPELKRSAEDLDAAETPSGKRVRPASDAADPLQQPSLPAFVAQPSAGLPAPEEEAAAEQQLVADPMQDAVDLEDPLEDPSMPGQPLEQQGEFSVAGYKHPKSMPLGKSMPSVACAAGSMLRAPCALAARLVRLISSAMHLPVPASQSTEQRPACR